MQDIATLSGAISTYGLYTIIAILCIAVVYLFKKVNDLHIQIQAILTDQSKSHSELIMKTTVVIENNNKILERVERMLNS